MKNYLIYSTDMSSIQKKINELITKNNIDSNNIVKYNLSDTSFSDVIEEANTISLFGGIKLIIVDTTNNIDKIDISIEEYFKKANNNNIIIFISQTEKLDTRKKIVKILEKNTNAINMNQTIDNAVDYIKEVINSNNYKIDNYLIKYLEDKIGNNISNIDNELNKLFLLKMEEKEITKDDIDSIISNNMDDEIFALTDAVVKGDINKSLDLYQEFRLRNYEPLQIIALLGNQFIFLYQVKSLYNSGKNQSDIATLLEVHPYRVKLAIQNTYTYTLSDLKLYISKLANLDKNIKLGNIDKYTSLELFLINKDF